MTLRELLKAVAPYPIPDDYITAIGKEIRVDMAEDAEDVNPVSLNRAKARVYLYLATIPNVSEGGVSISFTAMEKKFFLDFAKRFAALAGETALIPGVTYGYKGDNI